MKKTVSGAHIYAEVLGKKRKIALQYRVGEKTYIIEIPITKLNDHLKVGDEVEMSLAIFKG